MRGEKLFGSASTRLVGYAPLKGPVKIEDAGQPLAVAAFAAAAAPTGHTKVPVELMSSVAMWPCNSVQGEKYSHRSPRFSVSPRLRRQSSCAYKLPDHPRKYRLESLTRSDVDCGKPSRKSAKSYPVFGSTAPVELYPLVSAPSKLNEPREPAYESEFDCIRR